MAGVRCADLQSRPTACLHVTSVTLDACPHLVPPFEAAFHAPMAAWRLAGTPRTARQFPVAKPCPLPRPDDRRLCMLVALKTAARHVLQGPTCGRGQSTAQQGRHVLCPALLAALRTLGAAPARSLTALAPR